MWLRGSIYLSLYLALYLSIYLLSLGNAGIQMELSMIRVSNHLNSIINYNPILIPTAISFWPSQFWYEFDLFLIKRSIQRMSEIWTKASSDFSTFGFRTFEIFGTHTKRSDFSMFGFQTRLKSECSNVYHWLLNGLRQAFLVLLWHSHI